MENEWTAYHVFIWDYSVLDDFINNLYEKLSPSQQNNIFFIRYWEGSPHVRIRFRNIEKELVKRAVNSSLKYLDRKYPYLRDVVLDKWEFYSQTYTDGEEFEIDKLPWFENFSVKEIPYSREVERYGGIEGMKFSEELFVKSSMIVDKILKKKPNNIQKTILFFGIVSFIVSTVFDDLRDKKDFFIMSSGFWEMQGLTPSFSNEKSSKIFELSKYTKQNELFEEMSIDLKELYRVIKKRDRRYGISVVNSHIHMFANRFGVPINTELACYRFFREYLGEQNHVVR